MADVDLPVATQGTEQWAGVVAKAMTVNGRSQSESLQALKSFQDSVTSKMSKTVSWSCILIPPFLCAAHMLKLRAQLL